MSLKNRTTDMYNAIYTVNDAQYSITDAEEIHLKLQSDADFLSEYLANSTTAPGSSSGVSSPIRPISVMPPISERLEKSYRMSSLHNMQKKQLDIEERRIEAILELKSSIENSNNIQKERNDLLRNLLLKISRTETERNT